MASHYLKCSLLLLCASPLARAEEAPAPFRLENVEDGTEITGDIPAEFRILAEPGVERVLVSANGVPLGYAERNPETNKFYFDHTFEDIDGDQDITFSAININAEGQPTSFERTARVRIKRPPSRPAKRLFNGYILKAVSFLNKNYALLGYNIKSQMTHPITFSHFGTFQPTGNGLTMCVAGVLEVIVTAFNLYASETGDNTVHTFLPFKSWSTLDDTSIKAQIWVNPKLGSSGTGDALAHFGIGEKVKFRDLQPGGFININRTTGSGHAVTFLSFIDIKGNDVPNYNDSVVGFRYFGSQGRGVKGEGGLSFRHAFFSKYGCPDVPYKRDCNVILSDDSRLLNVGQMLDPSNWRHPAVRENFATELPAMSPADQALVALPQDFDGKTTDD